jgi:hypothetical protein
MASLSFSTACATPSLVPPPVQTVRPARARSYHQGCALACALGVRARARVRALPARARAEYSYPALAFRGAAQAATALGTR